jgi:hypothetical protein
MRVGNEVEDEQYMIDEYTYASLRCDRCGAIETPPYDDGDSCVCGGIFHAEAHGLAVARTVQPVVVHSDSGGGCE